jgi:uncharacterized protein (TIGR03083 family)
MTRTQQDVDERVQVERNRLLGVLEGLDEQQWRTPSLCAGWSVRELVVHLCMPYELSVPRFLAMMLRARFDFDRAADRWATADRRSPAEALAALRATEGRRFTGGPKAPAEAPLSHLVIHAEDVYRPLGVPSPADPEDVAIVLDQLTGPHADSLAPGLQEGLSFTATDVAWRSGDGPEVSGPAAALLTTLAGRTAGLSELSGDGVAQVRERLQLRRPG